MRIILFTGKGGVGKTTTAAATALKSAEEGKMTLVLSTDPAHSLSDAFNKELTAEPLAINEKLHAQELDVYYSMRKYWSNMRQLMSSILRWQGVEHILAEELAVIPGMEEASAFLWVEKYFREGFYDVIIIDSAPTGETMNLLTLPQITGWWMKKAFPGQRFAIKSVGSVLRRSVGIPLDKGYEELEFLLKKLEDIQKVFQDDSICSIRIVANPERMVIQEAKRAFTYLQLYGYNVDAIVVNRLLPESAADSFMKPYLESQRKYLHEIEDSFAGLPVLKCAHQGQEVFGEKMLHAISEEIYEGIEPTEILYAEKPIRISEIEEGYLLKIHLPFTTENDYQLKKFGDELVVDIANRRRNFVLPRFAGGLVVSSHELIDKWLNVILHEQEMD